MEKSRSQSKIFLFYVDKTGVNESEYKVILIIIIE